VAKQQCQTCKEWFTDSEIDDHLNEQIGVKGSPEFVDLPKRRPGRRGEFLGGATGLLGFVTAFVEIFVFGPADLVTSWGAVLGSHFQLRCFLSSRSAGRSRPNWCIDGWETLESSQLCASNRRRAASRLVGRSLIHIQDRLWLSHLLHLRLHLLSLRHTSFRRVGPARASRRCIGSLGLSEKTC